MFYLVVLQVWIVNLFWDMVGQVWEEDIIFWR